MSQFDIAPEILKYENVPTLKKKLYSCSKCGRTSYHPVSLMRHEKYCKGVSNA